MHTYPSEIIREDKRIEKPLLCLCRGGSRMIEIERPKIDIAETFEDGTYGRDRKSVV